MEAAGLPPDTLKGKHAKLFQACAKGHTGMVNQVLDACTEEEKYNLLMLQASDGVTAIAMAAYYGHTKTVQYILNSVDSGMRYELLQVRNEKVLSALRGAAHNGHTKVLKAILNSVTKEEWYNLLMLQDGNGHTAIDSAAYGGYAETVQYILNSVDSDKRYEMLQVRRENALLALHRAANKGHTEVLKAILNSVTQEQWYNLLMLQDSNGVTAIALAALGGHTETVQYILNSVDSDKRYELLKVGKENAKSAVHGAAHDGHTEVLKAILDSVTEEQWYNLLMLQGSEGVTAIVIAAFGGHTETVQYILNSVDSDKRYDMLKAQKVNKISTLIITAHKGHAGVLETISNSVAEPELHDLLTERGGNGPTPLHFAASEGHTDVIDDTHRAVSAFTWYELLNIEDDAGDNILLEALRGGHATTAIHIVGSLTSEHAVDLLVKEDSERAPICFAAAKGLSDFVKFALTLVGKAPIRDLKPICNRPLFEATSNGHTETVQNILNSLGSIRQSQLLSSQHTEGKTGLHMAASRGHTNTVDSILKCMSKQQAYELLTTEDNSGRTVVAEAARKSQVAAIQPMLNSVEAGSVNDILKSRDETGRTALHHAATCGNLGTLVNLVDSLLSDEQKTELLSIEDNNGQKAEQVPICALQDSSDEHEGTGNEDTRSGQSEISIDMEEDESGSQPIAAEDDLKTVENKLQKYYTRKLHTLSKITNVRHSFAEVAQMLKDNHLKLTPTQAADVKALYNTAHVYQMTSPRGLALVINNHKFSPSQSDRIGSDVDVRNMYNMLKLFDFDVLVEQDLTGEKMLRAISSAKMKANTKDYGMLVLVIMSHGTKNDLIFGIDGNLIDLQDVYDMLSSHNFPAMAGKPKLLILQACSGAYGDFGDEGKRTVVSHIPIGDIVRPSIGASSQHVGESVHPVIGADINRLTTDDLLVIKASFNTYASIRSDIQGSPFITSLVHNFYKHAHEKDVRMLCDMIQHDVRAWSIELAAKHPGMFGQVPTCLSMLTHYRKLHLFPGYNGENRTPTDMVPSFVACSALILLLALLYAWVQSESL